MLIPKYVQDILQRSRISDRYEIKGMNPGYTLTIRKATPYTKLDTFAAELERFCRWAERNFAESYVLDIPSATHYVYQTAEVVVTDPVMRYLEKLMEEK